MELSAFGNKFAARSGIVELMDDLGTALSERPDMLFLGGGNPARIPEMEEVFRRRLEAIMKDTSGRHSLFGVYQSPQGDRVFRQELAAFLSRQFGWRVGEENVAVSNGSQAAFFILHNLFAGAMPDGGHRRIHFPLAPEYIGYSDIGLSDDFFSATKPRIELLEHDLFKYHVDFSQLDLGPDVAAMCVSRPTNPTGNVLTDQELAQLDDIARQRGIPLMVDGAYGLPFPGILFEDANPHWNRNTILALSLSKLGLPGARTGIVVAREDIVQAFTNANTIVNLACGTLGPLLAQSLLRSDELLSLSREYVQPFYRERAEFALSCCRRALDGLRYRIHKPEGAIFLWLWFEGLPISSQQLYQQLKDQGVLVIPGHNFFTGLDADWGHVNECIRVSYARGQAEIRQGIDIIAEQVRKAYNGDTS